MIRVIQRRLIIPRGDTGTFTVPALSPGQAGSVGVFTIFDPITKTRIFQKQVELEGNVFNIEFGHGDTVNLQAGDYLWDIKFYKNPIFADNKVIDGEEIDSYYAAFQTPKCEIRETGDAFMSIEGAHADIEDINLILAATQAANAAKDAATEQAGIAADKAEQAAARLAEMIAAIPTKVSELENDSGYLSQETDPTVPTWAKAQTKPSYTPQEVGALPANTYIPSKTSDLTNDSNYAVDANYVHTDNNYTTAEKNKLSGIASGAEVNVNADWNAIEGDAFILNKPTKVSDFQNDTGFITSAALPTKVSDLVDDSGHYTKPVTGIPAADLEESYIKTTDYASMSTGGIIKVGPGLTMNGEMLSISQTPTSYLKGGIMPYFAVPVQSQHYSAFYGLAKAAGDTTQSQSDNAVGTYTDSAKTAIQQMLGVPSTAAIPTLVSQLTNDSGYLTSFTETDPTVPSWAKAAQKPTYTAAEVGAPTVQEMNTAIGNAIGNINSFDMAVVQALPTQDISTHTIYLVPKTGETNDVYDEYVYINNAWEMVGNTQVDLSNYVQKTDYASDTNSGVVKSNASNGIRSNNGVLTINPATSAQVKAGIESLRPITPNTQSKSVFYGLASASGDTTQSASNNAVGTYTDEAKTAIQNMLDVPSNTDLSSKADKTDTVLETTLSRGRKDSTTVGGASLAFGVDTEASGYYSVALGLNTTASSQGAFAEGKNTVAHYIAHAEGEDTQALGQWAHSQGVGTIAKGAASFAGGDNTIANGHSSFVTGRYNAADSYDNWAFWAANTSYAVGDKVKREQLVNNEPTIIGYICKEANTDETFDISHWDFDSNHMNYSVIVGNGYETEDPETHQVVRHGSNAYALDWDGTAHYAGDVYVNANNDSSGGKKVATIEEIPFESGTGIGSAKIKTKTIDQLTLASEASGDLSFATGMQTCAIGTGSHSEGYHSIALGPNSHAEGYYVTAGGIYSHAEGKSGITSPKLTGEANSLTYTSTAYVPIGARYVGKEIYVTNVIIDENNIITLTLNATLNSTAAVSNKRCNFIIGGTTNEASHSEGTGTIAYGISQHVQGKHNIVDDQNIYADIVGNGLSINVRSNAYALGWDGTGHFMGDVYVGANADSTGGTRLATIAELATKLDAAEAGLKVVRLI